MNDKTDNTVQVRLRKHPRGFTYALEDGSLAYIERLAGGGWKLFVGRVTDAPRRPGPPDRYVATADGCYALYWQNTFLRLMDARQAVRRRVMTGDW